MSYGASDEVAEDFRVALDDLTMNSRYEIGNLTVIAKENTEHALAIAEALKEHIKKIGPTRKLPALYLLDSIAKNVGTPYTLFFGRQLFATFMESYALVDGNTRRKMEEMLKTWKEPVPGSIDPRPVFSLDVIRPIENALLKARTSAIQANQQNARSQHLARVPGVAAPKRNTPTPPTQQRYGQNAPQNFAQPQGLSQPAPPQAHNSRQGTPQQFGVQQQNSAYAGGQSRDFQQQPAPSYQTPPVGTASWQQPASQGQSYRVPDSSIDTLNRDIGNLIDASKVEFAQNPFDGSIQSKLKALLDLQGILTSRNLPAEQIALIKERVQVLSASIKPQPAPQAVQAPVNVPQQSAQPTLASLFGGQGAALAALLAKSGQIQNGAPAASPSLQPGIPQSNVSQTPYPQVVQPPKPVTPAPQASSLLDQLRAAGLLPSATPVVPPPPTLPNLPNPSQLAMLAGRFPGGFPPPPPLHSHSPIPFAGMQWPPSLANDVQLSAASLKIPRPHLIISLYESLGIPCSQCGRRFKNDAEGKKKKTAHMDWHFKVNQRMVDAEKRGQHRSWFVDELDWIKSREVDEEHLATSSEVAAAKEAADKSKTPKLKWIPVPNDPVLAQSLCPICQEKFEMKWLDDAQEWVWIDAVQVGSRIYHASCHSDAKRDGSVQPEPVLGKRKNEDLDVSVRTRVKSEY